MNYVEIYSNQFNVIGPGGQHRSLMIAQGLYAYHNYKVLLITPRFKAYYESVISRPQDFLDEGTLNSSSLQKLKAYLANGLALPLRALSGLPAIIVLPSPVVRANVSIFKRLKRGKVILDFGDIWFSQRDPRVYKVASTWYLNVILANFVDYVVMPTIAMTEFVLKLLPSQLRNKVVHIPSAIDTRIVRPTRKASRPKIAYIGSLVGGRIEMLPYIAKKTIAQCKDVEFVIIGSGPMREWLRKKAGELELERNFTLIGDVNFSGLPRVCGDCWVGLSLVREETIYPVDILKSLVYMALGMPIIASRIIEEASDVLVRTRPDPLSFANAICSLVRNYSLIEELSQRARDRAVKFYDVGVISNKYHSLLAR